MIEIKNAYQDNKPQTKAILAAIMNRLIDSSYKLSAWRINEPAGLGKKYHGKPNAARLEYSRHSLAAIRAILATQKSILHSDNLDLKDLPNSQKNPKIISILQEKLEHTISLANTLKEPLTDKLTSKTYLKFADSAKDLHQGYYLMLPDMLNLQGKVLDADGD